MISTRRPFSVQRQHIQHILRPDRIRAVGVIDHGDPAGQRFTLQAVFCRFQAGDAHRDLGQRHPQVPRDRRRQQDIRDVVLADQARAEMLLLA